MRYVLLVCVAPLMLSGCAAIEDYHYCFVNHRRAAIAWYTDNSGVERRASTGHYKDGWRTGYFDVSTGGCGEPPVIPPNKYWSTKYQSVQGQASIGEWYLGFQDGAAAAASAGSGAFHWIPTGPTVPQETLGLANGAMDGVVYEELDALHDSGHFLEPFAPLRNWPPLPDLNTEGVAPSAANNAPAEPATDNAPAPPATTVAPGTASASADTTPPVALPMPNAPAPAAPAEVNTVPPVITEE